MPDTPLKPKSPTRLLRRFWRGDEGAVSIEHAMLAGFIALAVLGGVFGLGTQVRSLFDTTSGTFNVGTGGGTGGEIGGVTIETPPDKPVWSTTPDFVIANRRLPRQPDHETLWAIPFHANALPMDLPVIGGRSFQLIGDGNPRMLIAGGDPRVISGPDNPQYDTANYAASGIAYGTGEFHRILIDRPPLNATYKVQKHVDGVVVEYSFTNRPY